MLFTPTPDFARDLTLQPLEWHQRMCEWFRSMRDTEPVSYSEATQCWRVYRYDDVVHVRHDYTTFSSEHRISDRSSSIISMDPPRHRQLRSLVTIAFSPHTIAQMAPRITNIARDLLTLPLQRGKMDFVSEFAVPLPIKVIATMLDIPLDDWQAIHEWSFASVANPPTDASPTTPQMMREQQLQVTGEMYNYFAPLIAARRRQPGHDLISLLLAAELDGQRLSEKELLGFCLTLLVAGNITTTQLLDNALLCFDKHPAAWQQLLQNRSVVPSAIEEILRYLPAGDKGLAENTGALTGRTATTDVMLGGQLIHKGDIVNVSTLSANFDERHFPVPEHFAIQRTPNHHLSFGYGIHFCIGAPLARLEAKIALELLLEMMPHWSIRPGTQLELLPSSTIFGVKRLPILTRPAIAA